MEKSIPPNCPPMMYHGECHMNLLRKMQASFAWDWGLAAPSMGIWKDVQVEFYDSITIQDVTYQLIDDEDTWTLKIFAHIDCGISNVELDGVMSSELM